MVCLDEKPVVLHGEVRAGKQARPGTWRAGTMNTKNREEQAYFAQSRPRLAVTSLIRHLESSGRSPLTPKEGVNGPPNARCPP